jgi:hypothetical protein
MLGLMSARALDAQNADLTHARNAPAHVLGVRLPSSNFRVDGVLNEPLWRVAPVTSAFVQREPTEGAPATSATEVRVIFAEDAIVIGARLDEDRSTFRAAGLRAYDDFFEILIDPHPGHLTALALSVSPFGVKRSSMVTQDGSRDESWQIQWEAATRIDDDGWSVEIRLPFSELHIAPGREAWGVQFVRFSNLRQETDVYAAGPVTAHARTGKSR